MKNPKPYLIMVILLMAMNQLFSDPIFYYRGQTINLYDGLTMTDDMNASTIMVGGSPVSVTKYRFEFSRDSLFSAYNTGGTVDNPPMSADGWYVEMLPGVIQHLSAAMPILKMDTSYFVRVRYQTYNGSNYVWSGSTGTSQFSTIYGRGFNYASGSDLDLFITSVALVDGDNNLVYPAYRFEFSTDSAFSTFASSPTGWYYEITPPAGARLGLVDNLQVDQKYFVRVRAKTATMTDWSLPGPVSSFNTVNMRYYSAGPIEELYSEDLSDYDFNSGYQKVRFEFWTDSTFSGYDSTNAGWYAIASSSDRPDLGTVPNLNVDRDYYVRERVKTASMSNWSKPGPVIPFHTINTCYFYYCDSAHIDLKSYYTLTSHYASTPYKNYRYEFCTDSSFTNTAGHPLVTLDTVLTIGHPVILHTTVPALQFSTVYYTRIRVKQFLDSAWSSPGPLCTFTTIACIPNSTACPAYDTNCVYRPLHYYTFDNDCNPFLDCMSSSTYDQGYRTENDIVPGKVGSSVKARVTDNLGRSWSVINAGFPSGSGQDYTVEFYIKMDGDSYLQIDDERSKLPYFSLSSNNIRAMYSIIPPVQIYQDLQGLDRLSPSYYFNKEWHHIALKFASSTRLFELFVDGQSPAPFKLHLDSTVVLATPDSTSAFTFNIYDHTFEGVDEFAVYNQALPEKVIYQHYLESSSGSHYSACTLDTTVVLPTEDPITGNFDANEYVPGYGDDIITPGIVGSYYSSDLVSEPSTIDQITSFPAPRFKPGHGLNPNINWTDTKYLGFSYQSTGDTLAPIAGVFDPNNDAAIQTELAKNWNYMFNLSGYGGDAGNSVINTVINANPQFKLALISNINFKYYDSYLTERSNYLDVDTSDLNLSPYADTLTYPSGCPNPDSVRTFQDPNYTDVYKMMGRMLFKDVITTYVQSPNPGSSLVPLTHKIDFVSDDSFEDRITPSADNAACLYGGIGALASQKASIYVPTNPVAPEVGAPTWNDYCGYIAGQYYKEYADNLINVTTPFYGGYKSSDIFSSDKKFLFYLISGIYEWENYSTKRVCNTPYVNGSDTNYYSTPNFYPWSGPFGWYVTSAQFWGLGALQQRSQNEIPLGDKMYAPFVSARWTRDASSMRPGQYLGFLKAMAMWGVDFYHVGYFNVTVHGLWPVMRYPGDAVGFANDPRTWVWQLATASYAQGTISRCESMIRNSNVITTGKYGNDFYVINKHKTKNKYLVYGTEQTLSNYQGASPLSKDLCVHNDTAFKAIPNFKFNVRRQGSMYVLDMADSTKPVFYQLDKWHEYSHPGYWSKDFDFEAEVDDSGDDSLQMVTELPSGAAPGDYTDYTTGVKLKGSHNITKYDFIPRDVSASNNHYQVWIRMRSIHGTSGRVEVKLDGSNKFIVDNVTDSTWQWYGYESCNGTRMILRSLSTTGKELTLVSGTDNLLIDQVSLKMDTTLDLSNGAMSPPSPCGGCCSFSSRQAATTQTVLPVKKEGMPDNGAADIKMHPNPASNQCTISSSAIAPGSTYLVTVSDLTGREVVHMEVKDVQGSIIIDTRSLVNGLYMVNLQDSDGKLKYIQKLVIQHH